MALFISGNPGCFLIRDKNDHFQVDVVFDTLTEAIYFAIELQKPENATRQPSDVYNEWSETVYDDDCEFEKAPFQFEDEMKVEKSGDFMLIRENDNEFVYCRAKTYEMIKNLNKVFGFAMTYEQHYDNYVKK